MEKTCLNCDEPFEGRRADAKYCSDDCKKDYRNKMVSAALKGDNINQGGQVSQLAQPIVPPGLDGFSGYVFTQSQSQISDLTQRLAAETAEKNRALIELQNEKMAHIKDVNDLKRELDKKDFELEKKDADMLKIAEDAENKSGLNGIVDTVSNSETLLAKILDRVMSPPGGAPVGQLAGAPEGVEWSEATLVFANWFQSATPDLQQAVWNMIETLAPHGPNMLPLINQFIAQLNQVNHERTGTDA